MNTLLLSSPAYGAVVLLLSFALCFFLVHLFRLARIGWNASRQTPPPPQKKEEAKPPEPVYYIVEKKKKIRKPKTEYAEPKEIRFR